jgi:hypothetical protein
VIALLPLFLGLLQALPQIITAIKAAEAAITTPKSGPAKKALVMAALPAGADPQLVSGVSSIIDTHVAAFNAAAIFKHSEQAAPPAPPAPPAPHVP